MNLGDIVFVGGDIPGRITAITHRLNGTTYEVSWWDGRNRCTDWFVQQEITIEPKS